MTKLLLIGVCIALLPIFTISGINAPRLVKEQALKSTTTNTAIGFRHTGKFSNGSLTTTTGTAYGFRKPLR